MKLEEYRGSEHGTPIEGDALGELNRHAFPDLYSGGKIFVGERETSGNGDETTREHQYHERDERSLVELRAEQIDAGEQPQEREGQQNADRSLLEERGNVRQRHRLGEIA